MQVLCDACLFDASSLTWKLREPTPFARCAHTAVALPSGEMSRQSCNQIVLSGMSCLASDNILCTRLVPSLNGSCKNV